MSSAKTHLCVPAGAGRRQLVGAQQAKAGAPRVEARVDMEDAVALICHDVSERVPARRARLGGMGREKGFSPWAQLTRLRWSRLLPTAMMLPSSSWLLTSKSSSYGKRFLRPAAMYGLTSSSSPNSRENSTCRWSSRSACRKIRTPY